MDSYSSWENHNIKTRKPYTITKQRERWTEDEHNSFLEALKLYGRAWQRIEEHIGTKTAVQIRSHAQKFFTKLEKEAVAKGVPIGHALDLEIPPPRPKRKPNYPYPRKIHTREAEKQATSVSSLQLLDLERKPLPEKASHTENLENENTSVEAQNDTESPQENETAVQNESFINTETEKQDGIFESLHLAHENTIQGPYSDKPVSLIHDIQGKQTYPRHVPVQVVDVHQEVSAKTGVPLEMPFHESEVNKLGEVHEQHSNPSNLFVNIAAAFANSGQNHNNASKSSTIPAFHPPFIPFSDNQENYRSFLHFSSTHAAASFAAKFWHPVNTESSADSFSRDQLNTETTPRMAAIAAATVAAATAWWSAHGLLPVCTPFFPGGCSGTFVTPTDGREKAPSEGILQEEKMDAEYTEDLSSSDEPEEKLNFKEMVSVVEPQDSDKTNVGKQIDRSSCGSNTTSSSELEMDALERHGKEIEETKRSDVKESNLCHIFWKLETEMDHQNIKKNSELDLNRMCQEAGQSNGFVGEEGVWRMGLGSVKLNVHHTGFRPYKRCSIESSKIVSAASTGDEKGPKRMCLGTEAAS